MSQTPDVPNPEKIVPQKGPEFERMSEPDVGAFQKFMEKPLTTEKIEPSPIELARQSSALSPTFDTLNGQILISNNQLSDIRNDLNTPNLKFKNSHERLLTTKLNDAFDHIQKASNYLGAPQIKQTEIPQDAQPVLKFLSFITDGQNQLLQAKQRLEELQGKGEEMKPGEMMLVQVNLAQAQQEIEFASLLLSKLVDALKQTITIQIS